MGSFETAGTGVNFQCYKKCHTRVIVITKHHHSHHQYLLKFPPSIKECRISINEVIHIILYHRCESAHFRVSCGFAVQKEGLFFPKFPMVVSVLYYIPSSAKVPQKYFLQCQSVCHFPPWSSVKVPKCS